MADKMTTQELMEAGVHFGHLTRKWNPRMSEYIFMENNGIHIIDLNKTLRCLEEATFAIKNIVRSGRKIMLVATKKQAKDIIVEEATRLNMPFVTERWLGGMLTNFATIRKSLKKLAQIDKLMKDEAFNNLAKRERLMVSREKAKLEKLLGGIADLNRLPAALFVIDVKREHIAVAEAQKLNIPVFAMVDTNSDPSDIDFPIPSNDDAFKSISIITKYISKAIEEALMERKKDKEETGIKKEEDEKRKVDEAVQADSLEGGLDALHSLLGMSGEAGASALHQLVRRIYVPMVEERRWPDGRGWVLQIRELAARTDLELTAYAREKSRAGAT